MASVFVHRSSHGQQVCSENLDFLVGNTHVFFLDTEILLHLRQLRALGLDAFGFPVDPILFGLDVLRSVLRAIEFLLVPLEFFFQNSLAR